MSASNTPIKTGSRVMLHFSLRLKDGTIADSSRGGDPVEWVIGSGEIIDGLENCLLGLKVGDQRRFELKSEDAYGPAMEDVIYNLPRTMFPSDMELEPGQVIGFEIPSGEEIPGTIIEVNESEVQVDFSHPLAGHDLIFDVEVLSVNSGD